MNFKRILVLVMTFAMLLSTFAPTLGVFAEELQNQAQDKNTNTNKDTLDYVSLGDSMTNGIGMPGYDATGKNGYLEEAPDAYPSQFAGWLESFTGKEVSLTQLATSAARIEDVYYLLTKGTEKEFTPDYWTVRELLTNPDRWGKTGAPRGEENWDKHMDTNNTVANVFQSSVANADVISLATGNGNFGVFFMGRLMNLVGFGSAEELALDNEKYAHMTVENALELCGANEEVKELVMGVYNDAEAYLVEAGMPSDLIVAILNYLVYTTASYVVTYMNVIDYIAEVNPDATVIILPLINNGLDFNFDITLHGITKSFNAGDFLGALYTPINAFMAAYTTVANETGASDNTYYYAELPEDENGETIQVETFAQAFETLYVPVEAGMTEATYPANRLFCHDRFIGDILDFVFGMLNLEYVSFDKYDVRDFELAKANGTLGAYMEKIAGEVNQASLIEAGTAEAMKMVEAGELTLLEVEQYVTNYVTEKVTAYVTSRLTSMSMYLGFIEAILAAMENAGSADTAPVMNFDEITVGESFSMVTLLDGLTGDLFTKVENKTNEMAAPYVQAGVDGAVAALLVMPEAMEVVLLENGTLQTLLALYGKLKLAWGLSAHPSYNGHDTLTQSLIDAYKNEYTAKDETIDNIKTTINEIIKVTDEAYQKAYDKVDNAGYINKVVSLIDRVINRLNKVDLADNEPMTNELKALLDVEIDALIETLKEIKDVLVNDKASDLRGLVATVRGLMDDVVVHTENILAICEQAGLDIYEFILVPALEEALFILETEVLPELERLVNEFVDAVVAHVVEKAEMLYNVAMGISKEVYVQVVKVVATVQLYAEKVEEVVNTVVEHYFMLVDVLETVYGEAKAAHDKAVEIFNALVAKALEVKNNIDEVIRVVVATYPVVLEKVYEVLGNLDTAIEVTNKVIDYVIYRVSDVVMDVNDIAVLANDIVALVYDILVDAGVPVEEAMEIAAKVAGKLLDVVLEKVGGEEKVLEIVEGMLNNALDLLLNSGLTYEQALTTSVAALTSALATIVRHFNDIDNALDFTKAVLQTVYDYLVENRVEITEALKMAVDATKAIVAAIFEGIEDAKALNKAVEELLKTVYDLLIEAGLDAEEALKVALEIGKAILAELAAEANEYLAVIVEAMVKAVYGILVEAGMAAQEALVKALECLKGMLADLVAEAKEQLEAIAMGMLGAAYDLLAEVGMAVEEALQYVLATVYDALVEAGMTVKEAIDYVANIAKAIAKHVLETAEDVKAAMEFAKNVFNAVYNFLLENGTEIKQALEIAVNVYKAVVEFVIENAEDIKAALEIAVEAFEFILEVAQNVLATIEDVYELATDVYAYLVEVAVKIHNTINTTIDVYNFVYDLLLNVFGSIENAVSVATKICNLVVEFIQNTPELLENAYALYLDIYNLIVEVYGETGDAHETAQAVYTYVVGLIAVVFEDLQDAIYHASNGNYVITENSFYLALGYSFYTEELAEMLHLGNNFTQHYELTENYLEALAKADLVTVKLENGELFDFAYTQILGVAATIIRNSDVFVNYGELIEAAISEYGLSIYQEPKTLEWSKYMDEEMLAIFRDRMDALTTALVNAGVPELLELDFAPILESQLPEGATATPIIVNIPVAELMVFAIENVLYAYAETAARVANTLSTIYEVAPNATVVITAISNPFEIVSLLLGEFVPGISEYVAVVDEVVEYMNLPLYLTAVANKNTIFVQNEDAAEIYEALHARCAHAYDNVCDTTCNICGEEREVPGHVYDNACDTTCNACGEVREVPGHVYDNACDTTCNVCGEVREVPGHVYDNACDKDCNVCGATRTPADHVYDDEYDATCNVCGEVRKVPEKPIDDDKGKLSTGIIVLIAVGSVTVACGAGAAVYWFLLKRKEI